MLDTPIFHQIGEVADHLGMECYVVGGFVRDLFLERPSKDIDCLVVALAYRWQRNWPSDWEEEHTSAYSATSGRLR